MTWLSMLFCDKPLVIPCIFQDEDGNEVVKPVEIETYLKGDYKIDKTRFIPGKATPGYKEYEDDDEFDYCFSGHTTKKPKYDYTFGFAPYSAVTRMHGDYGVIVTRNAVTKEFLVYQVEERGTQMYMIPCLYIDHVLTDEDFDNAVDFRLSDYCFELG